MSGLLLAAAIVVLLTALSHSVLGEMIIFRHIAQVENVPPFFGSEDLTKRTLRFVWHLEALLFGGVALILGRYAIQAQRGETDVFVILSLAGTLLACAVVTLAITRAKHPAWVAFLGAALLSWMGAR